MALATAAQPPTRDLTPARDRLLAELREGVARCDHHLAHLPEELVTERAVWDGWAHGYRAALWIAEFWLPLIEEDARRAAALDTDNGEPECVAEEALHA